MLRWFIKEVTTPFPAYPSQFIMHHILPIDSIQCPTKSLQTFRSVTGLFWVRFSAFTELLLEIEEKVNCRLSKTAVFFRLHNSFISLVTLVAVRNDLPHCRCRVLLLLPFVCPQDYSVWKQQQPWFALGVHLLSAIYLDKPTSSCIPRRKKVKGSGVRWTRRPAALHHECKAISSSN
jgi:hypothetical protein